MVERGQRVRLLTATGCALAIAFLVWWILDGQPESGPVAPLTDGANGAGPDEGGPVLATAGQTPSPTPGKERTGDGRVSGVVLDADDAPVAEVEVVARRATGWYPRDRFRSVRAPKLDARPVASARTDAAGHFVLQGLDLSSDDPALFPHFVIMAVVEPPRSSTRAEVANWGHVREQAVVLRVLTGSLVQARVVDAAGRGVAAIVSARGDTSDRRPGGASAWWGFGPQATEADGRFQIPSVPSKTLRFDVYVGNRMSLRGLRVDVPESGEMIIRLAGGGVGRVTGRVADPADNPVAKATVLVEVVIPVPGIARVRASATTGADGTFAIADIPAGEVRAVRARAAGFADGSWRDVGHDVRPGADARLDLTLVLGATLSGRVLDEQGAAVAGARVVTHSRSIHPRREGVTDAEGRYEIRGLAPGDYGLFVKARGYYDEGGPRVSEGGGSFGVSWRGPNQRREAYQVEVAAGGERLTRDLRLRRGRPVSGLVLGANGAPVRGALVRWMQRPKEKPLPPLLAQRRKGPARSRSAVHPLRLEQVAVTDEAGRFTHPGLGPPKGVWTFVAHTHDTSSETQTLTAFDNPIELTFRLRPLGSVAGRVIDASGAGQAQMTVRLDAAGSGTIALSLTDADGNFRFDGLHPATYEAHAMAAPVRHWAEVGSSAAIPVGAAQEVADIEIRATVVPQAERPPARPRVPRLRPTVLTKVEGTVLAPDGTPVESGTVTVRPSEGRSRAAAILRGHFATKVETQGTSVSFEVRDARDKTGRRITHAPFQLADQSVKSSPFTLQLSAGEAIAGRVEDEEGNGIEGVKVWIPTGRRGPRGIDGPTARTDKDGAFRLEGLTVGHRTLRIEIDAAFLGPREVASITGSEEMRIRFRRGALIAGTLLGPDGKGIGDVEMSAMPKSGLTSRWKNTRSDPDGSFRFVGLDKDETFTVRARPWERDVGRADLLHAYVHEVRPGREDIVLRLQIGVYLEGVLLLPDGSPAVGGIVSGYVGDGSERSARPAPADDEGRFRIGPFAAGERVTVTGYSRDRTIRPAYLRDVTAPSTGLVLRLTKAQTRKGRIEGESVGGFRWLWVRPLEAAMRDGHPHSNKGVVESDGNFLLTQLPVEGTVTVFVFGNDDDRYAVAEGVKPAGEMLVLTLKEGRTVAGKVDAAVRKQEGYVPFARIRSLRLGFDRPLRIAKDGSFRFRGLPPGRYEIQRHDMKGKVLSRMEVDAGAEDAVVR